MKYFVKLKFSGFIFSLFTALLFLEPFNIEAQSIKNIKVEQHSDTVIVSYDLESDKNNDMFSIKISVSNNNGESFLIKPITTWGNIGYGVRPGKGNKIYWLPLRDSLELVGNNYFFKITALLMGASKEIEFVSIKGGKFMMGSALKEAKSDERPVHVVYLDDFKLSLNEITNYQFVNFLNSYASIKVKDGEFKGEKMFSHSDRIINIYQGNNGQSYWKVRKGYDFYPVVGVTWFGANEFCKYYGYRLPTEAEWEYAAREGGKNIRFGNGKDIADPSEINFSGSSNIKKDYSVAGEDRNTEVRVCSFAPNKVNLFDMSGNVWEWCQDWYESNYYFHSKKFNPTGPWFGKYKVIRGGSWFNNAEDIRTTDRSFLSPYKWNQDIGFRVVSQNTSK